MAGEFLLVGKNSLGSGREAVLWSLGEGAEGKRKGPERPGPPGCGVLSVRVWGGSGRPKEKPWGGGLTGGSSRKKALITSRAKVTQGGGGGL